VTEHLVFYYADGIKIFSIIDTEKPGFASLMISSLPIPKISGVAPVDEVRLVHIDWDPTQPTDSYNNLANIVLMTSGFDSDDDNVETLKEGVADMTEQMATALIQQLAADAAAPPADVPEPRFGPGHGGRRDRL
jgi:hypothetical protein